MEIASIMKRLEDSTQASAAGVKTAADATPAAPATASTSEALRSELREVLNDAAKTAAAPEPTTPASAPVADLVKMATDLSNAEEEALLKQAQVYGAAICDGFMARYAQYETAASEVAPEPTKTAETQPATTDGDFNKFAQANPELVKEAYDLGYQTKMAQLKKTAEERFEAGYNDTLAEVHKTAAVVYKHGAEWAQWAVKTAEHNAQQPAQ